MPRLPLLLLALGACSWVASSDPPPPTTAAPTTGPTAADSQPLHGGGTMTRLDAADLARHVSASSEHVRVYNLWATWCGPCKAEMPALAAFGRASPQVELVFVNLDHPRATGDRVLRFIEEHELGGFAHLRPTDDELDLPSKLDGFSGVLPTTLVVAPDGTRAATFLGVVATGELTEATHRAAGG